MKATFTRATQGWFGVTLVAMGCAIWGCRAMAAPGDLDPSFKPELLPGENVVSIAVDGSGMIYAQLEVPRGAPAEAPLVVRLHPDGRRDPTFILPCGGPVEACWREDLVIAPDGSLYVPAKFGGEQEKPSLRRYTTDGTHDPGFKPQLSLNRCPTAILPTRDGRVWVAGTLADGRERFLGALEADGRVTTLRRPPTTGGVFEFMELVERPDGRVAAAGQFQWGGDHPRMSTAQFHPDLELDTTFSPPFPASNHLPFPTIWTATFQSDGRLLVGGLFLRLDEHRTSGIGRLLEDGAPDRSFSTPPMDDDVERIHVDAEGRILVVGDFRRIGGWIRPQLARLLPDGSVDGGFMPPTIQDRIQSTRMTSDGGLLVVAGANSKDRLFKLQGGECLHSPPEIAIQPKPSTGRVGGRLSLEVGVRSADSCRIQWFRNGTAIPTGTNVVLVLGKLTSIDNGTYAVRIENRRGSVSSRAVSVVVEPTEARPGWPDLRFGLGSGPDHTVEVLRSLPGSRILVAGGFRGLGTFTNTGPIVVLREDGSLDPMFRLRSISGRVDGLEILEDGRLLAWGFLNQPNPRKRRGVMVLHPNGEVDSSFGDSLHPSTEVRKVVRLRDGRFLVSGYLIPPAGDQVMSTLRLNPNGSLDTTFQPAENPGRMETFTALTSGRLAVVWKP